jgi:hypothetical protein
MKIGDRVKLRDIPENDLHWLEPYKKMAGVIVNHSHPRVDEPPKFLRVAFGENSYEDMLAFRVMLL